LRHAGVTTSDQSTSSTTGNVVVFKDTYVADFEYADKYNTSNDNVHCEGHTDIDRLECLSCDKIDDEDTSYWWDSYSELTIYNTRTNNTDHVQLSVNTTEYVPDNINAQCNTDTPKKYSISAISAKKVISSVGLWKYHWSSTDLHVTR